MSDLEYLIKNLQLKPGEDYSFLRKEGLTHIEQLSKKLWTDYNIHDPGITILELLSYAITDIGYRTGFDIKDLLTRIKNGTELDTGDFFTAAEILPTAPVTFNDLRKMLIDILGVRNAWITKNEEIQYYLNRPESKLKSKPANAADEPLNPLNGLYDVLIETEDDVREEPRINNVAKKENDGTGSYATSALNGINFKVLYPFTLVSVHVYAQTPGNNVTVRLLKKDDSGNYNETEKINATVNDADVKSEINLGFKLERGDYRLDANGTGTSLFVEDTHSYSTVYANLLSLISGFNGTNIDSKYYFFYDWKVSYAVNPFDKEKFEFGELHSAFSGLQEINTGISGGFILPGSKGLKFNVYDPLFLKTVTVFPESSGMVEIIIDDPGNNEIFKQTFDVTDDPEGTKISIDTLLDPGNGYAIKASGATKLHRDTSVTIFESKPNPALEVVKGIPTHNNYFYFYSWEIEYYHPVPYNAFLTKEEVLLAVKDTIYKQRSLSEDLMHIRDLEREFIGVCADIEVTDSADIQQVLAEIFYNLEMHVSPPVIFYTIDELQAKNYSTDKIFEGPRLQHGFIDDDEFEQIQRRCFLRTSDIIQIIMDVPGVVAVKEIKLLSYTEVTAENPSKPGDTVVTLNGIQYIVKEEEWILELSDPGKMAPDFDPEKSKIIFYKDDLPYLPDRKKALDLYNEKRSVMTSRKLRGIQRDFPVPIGEFKDVEEYYPVQNDLPATYMVGKYRVPDSESDLRKAQSKQLKAYLMFFEQILANYMSQLAHIRELFDWNNDEVKTYFTQVVNEISNLEDIYVFDDAITDPGMVEQMFEKLDGIIENDKIAKERRDRFLNHLMGRFAEDFTDYSLLMYSVYKESSILNIIDDKRDFIADYPTLSRNRGQGFDYRYPFLTDNISGLQRRVGRLMGFDNVYWRGLAGSRLSIERLESDEGNCEVGNYRFVYKNAEGIVLFKSICCDNRDNICVLLDSSILIGSCADNYKFDEDTKLWNLHNNCDDGEIVGTFVTDDFDDVSELASYFKHLSENEGFHVIEHILLRKRVLEDEFMPVQLNAPEINCEEACVEVTDPYSFRVTVFLPSWPKRFQSIRFRKLIERTLRLEAPAHVYLKICWINHCDMKSFEIIYNDWLASFKKAGVEYKGFPEISLTDFDTGSKEYELLSEHSNRLSKLIHKLHNVDNVHPLAAMHDCLHPDSENPQITLNQMSLGTN